MIEIWDNTRCRGKSAWCHCCQYCIRTNYVPKHWNWVMWTVATTSVDGLSCIGDGHVSEMDIIIPSLWKFYFFVVRCGNIQSRGQLFNYLSNPRIHPVCQRIRIQQQPTIRTHLAAIIPSNPSKIIGSKHPTIAYKLFPFQCQAPHRHLQTLSIIWVPMFTARYYSTDLSISRFDFNLFLLYKRTQNIPKAMSQYQQDNWTTSSLSSTTASYIIIMDMCRSWANESLQKINDTGVITKKYMLSSMITVLLWWYMESWLLRSVRCSRRAQLTIIVSGGEIRYFSAGEDIHIY